MHSRQGSAFARGAIAAVAAIAVMVLTLASPVAAQDDETVTVALNEYEDSGVSGWATLTAVDGGVHVVLAVEGDAVTGDHPTHIHTGTCDDFDPNPIYPLTTVILDPLSADGMSESTVDDVPLDELLTADHVILVHKSMEELTTYFVCGELTRDNAIPPPDAGSPGSVGGPSSGIGTAARGSLDDTALLATLCAFAVALTGAGLVLRRSGARA